MPSSLLIALSSRMRSSSIPGHRRSIGFASWLFLVVFGLPAKLPVFRTWLRRAARRCACAALGAAGLATSVVEARAQPVQVVRAVEIFGARLTPPHAVRQALGIAPGDTVPQELSGVRERLVALPGVSDASLSLVCCEQGQQILYVGVREGAAATAFAEAPEGIATLPDEVVRAESEFTAALYEAVTRGQAGEDHSAGHALMEYPPARAAQMRFIELAREHETRLREVLATSRFPMQRALAAQVLAYLPDKSRVVELLVPALRDPSPEVRNDAARALWIVAEYARDHAALRQRIPLDPLITLMRSLDFTDRNKASLVLMALTTVRDSATLATLDARLRPELEEMARWTTQHALPAVLLLGRIRGMPDDEIVSAWTAGNTEHIIR